MKNDEHSRLVGRAGVTCSELLAAARASLVTLLATGTPLSTYDIAFCRAYRHLQQTLGGRAHLILGSVGLRRYIGVCVGTPLCTYHIAYCRDLQQTLGGRARLGLGRVCLRLRLLSPLAHVLHRLHDDLGFRNASDFWPTCRLI